MRLLVLLALNTATLSTAHSHQEDGLSPFVCPQVRDEIRYERHSIPKRVFYTGKIDGHLRNLTYGPRGRWPADWDYYFYDNIALEKSMRQLDELMQTEAPGIFEAFLMLRPWAYRADLWRYCILWACGGIYVDSKLALAEPLDDFIWNAGFNPQSLKEAASPQLYSCRDELASNSMRRKSRVSCLWQGLLIAERQNVALLQTIRFVVSKVQQRWYPPLDLSKMPWLFLTGPGAIALATQVKNPKWTRHVKLRCRMTYTTRQGVRRGLQNPHLVGDWKLVPGENFTVYDDNMSRASFIADAGLHEGQRTNNYGKLFKSHYVYMDDELLPVENISRHFQT